MLKYKFIIVTLVLAMTSISCSDFTKVLNKGTSEEQYSLATQLYENEKYYKAIQLFEKIIPAYRGKPQMERIQFMLSNAYYHTKSYLLAAYHFDRFTKNYPKSTKKEEAAYLSAHAYYLSIPRSSLDQSDTLKAIESFQKYIDNYPESEKVAEANKYIKDMQSRLEKKAFDIAYLYYHTENYKAAVVAFDNFLSQNLGSSYKEETLYFKSKAAYELAMKSVYSKKEIRIKEAFKTMDRLEYNFKDSPYLDEINKLRNKLKDELVLLTSTSNN